MRIRRYGIIQDKMARLDKMFARGKTYKEMYQSGQFREYSSYSGFVKMVENLKINHPKETKHWITIHPRYLTDEKRRDKIHRLDKMFAQGKTLKEMYGSGKFPENSTYKGFLMMLDRIRADYPKETKHWVIRNPLRVFSDDEAVLLQVLAGRGVNAREIYNNGLMQGRTYNQIKDKIKDMQYLSQRVGV